MAPAATNHQVKVRLVKISEHSKTIKYGEDGDVRGVLGSAYIGKEALKRMGNPTSLTVTIEPAP